ncbi:MAG TPA: SOS response-associated peptidase family protein [Clostridiaceae bacterium]
MCARYVILTEEENREIMRILREINDKYKDQSDAVTTGEIFPSNKAPVIIEEKEKSSSEVFKWGYPGFNNSRCLIPASGFFEWKEEGKRKDKYLIRLKSSNFFYMAGLCRTFIDNEGKAYSAFVVITTQANSDMKRIHDRMPVILGEEAAYSFIKRKESIASIQKLIVPYSETLSIEKVVK